MAYPVRGRRPVIGLIVRAVLILAALWAALYICFGPASRFGMARHLKERYGRDFVILSAETAPNGMLDSRVFTARTFTAAPKNDPDFRFYASSYLATDGFWPVLHRYYNDTYVEDQMLRIWEEDARAAGLECASHRERRPLSRQEETFCSGYWVNIHLTPDNLDQVCALLSHSMERMLAETPARQGELLSFRFNLFYREDSWPEDDSNLTMLTLFYNSYHVDSSSHKYEWRSIDTDLEAIRQYILDEAARYEKWNYPKD